MIPDVFWFLFGLGLAGVGMGLGITLMIYGGPIFMGFIILLDEKQRRRKK